MDCLQLAKGLGRLWEILPRRRSHGGANDEQQSRNPREKPRVVEGLVFFGKAIHLIDMLAITEGDKGRIVDGINDTEFNNNTFAIICEKCSL